MARDIIRAHGGTLTRGVRVPRRALHGLASRRDLTHGHGPHPRRRARHPRGARFGAREGGPRHARGRDGGRGARAPREGADRPPPPRPHAPGPARASRSSSKSAPRHPEIPVVVVTAYSSVESAITAMREGAFHYIPKPFRNEEVVHVVRQALEKRRLVAENRALRAKLDAPGGLRELVGRSASMERVYETCARPRRRARRSSSPARAARARSSSRRLSTACRPRAAGPVRDGPLRRAPARPPRVESLRARARLVHGSRRGQEGPLQGRRRRHDLLRRDRDRARSTRRPSSSASSRSASSRPSGAVEPIRSDVRVIAATNADLTKARRRRPLPRGPLLPALRHHGQPAAAPRAEGRRPPPRRDASSRAPPRRTAAPSRP